MDHQQRVAWQEGMFLLPQHFQQADRQRQGEGRFLATGRSAHAWGLTSLQLDEAALASGMVSVIAVAGVLPDGTVVQAPAVDAPPPAREIGEHLPASGEHCDLYLALPLAPYGRPSAAADGQVDGRATRYIRRPAAIRDEDGGEEQEIVVDYLNLQLRFGDESRDDQVCLRLGRLRRAPNGAPELDPQVLPACLQLGASEAIGVRLRRIIALLVARESELDEQRRQRVAGHVEFPVSEILNTLVQQALAGSLPELLQLQREPAAHPRQLYTVLARLVGQLGTFEAGRRPRDVPAYEHDDFGRSLAGLEQFLGETLQRSAPTRYVPMPVQALRAGIHQASLPEQVQSDHRIFLSVACSLSPDRVSRELPQKAKITSGGRIGTLIAQALRGLTVVYQSVPPAEIPAQPDRSYFELQCQGEHWQNAVETGSLAIYLPPEYGELRLEFLAVRE